MPLGLDFTQVFLHLFNVAILFGGMYYLLYNPVMKFMEKREAYYQEMDEEKKTALKNAQDIQTDYENRIHDIETEISQEKQRAAKDLEMYREKRTKEAEEEARRIIEEAEEEAHKRRNAILDGTKDDIYDLINNATDKLLLDGTTDSFYDAFLEDAERSVENE